VPFLGVIKSVVHLKPADRSAVGMGGHDQGPIDVPQQVFIHADQRAQIVDPVIKVPLTGLEFGDKFPEMRIRLIVGTLRRWEPENGWNDS